jgi:hypothetical protein
MVARPGSRPEPRVDHFLTQAGSSGTERRHPVDHIDDQLVAVEVVEHHYVEWCCGSCSFLVIAHVQAAMIGAPAGEAARSTAPVPVTCDSGRMVTSRPTPASIRLLGYRSSGPRAATAKACRQFVVAADYRQRMIGDLIQTKKGWITEAPTHCPDGHKLKPGQVLVGFQPCGGAHPGGHTSWSCRCGASVYAPALGSACRVLHGAAGIRS